MNCFRYKIEHDFGFAPNPFHGTLSLATCKGDIRKNKNLQLGDWIVGLGSKSMGNLHHIVFAMKVEEKLTFISIGMMHASCVRSRILTVR